MPAVSGSPTQVRTSVQTLTELSGVPDDAFLDGDLAYVAQVEQNYRLVRASPTPAWAVDCYSATGYWEPLTADAISIQHNPVDPAAPVVGDTLVWDGASWTPTPTSSALAIYGAFSDSTSQPFTAGAAYVVKYNTTEETSGVTVENNVEIPPRPTRLQVTQDGVYAIALSPQMYHTGGGTEMVRFWLRKMDQNVPRSGSSFEMGNNNNRTLPYLEVILSLSAGEYVEWVFLATTGTNVSLEAFAEVVAPIPVPAIPSVIASVKRLGD